MERTPVVAGELASEVRAHGGRPGVRHLLARDDVVAAQPAARDRDGVAAGAVGGVGDGRHRGAAGQRGRGRRGRRAGRRLGIPAVGPGKPLAVLPVAVATRERDPRTARPDQAPFEVAPVVEAEHPRIGASDGASDGDGLRQDAELGVQREPGRWLVRAGGERADARRHAGLVLDGGEIGVAAHAGRVVDQRERAALVLEVAGRAGEPVARDPLVVGRRPRRRRVADGAAVARQAVAVHGPRRLQCVVRPELAERGGVAARAGVPEAGVGRRDGGGRGQLLALPPDHRGDRGHGHEQREDVRPADRPAEGALAGRAEVVVSAAALHGQ